MEEQLMQCLLSLRVTFHFWEAGSATILRKEVPGLEEQEENKSFVLWNLLFSEARDCGMVVRSQRDVQFRVSGLWPGCHNAAFYGFLPTILCSSRGQSPTHYGHKFRIIRPYT